MHNVSYTVVTLDGKEKQNISLEEVKNLFFSRQINQNSLVCSNENPQWQMLKRVFDLSQFVPANLPPPAPAQTYANHYQAAQNPFEQPVTFNQYPSNQTSNSYAGNPNQGYTQNNQTHSHYQAQTPPSQSNYQNNQSNYGSQGNQNQAYSNNYAPQFQSPNAHDRHGLRPAAIFLIVSCLLGIFQMLLENIFAQTLGPSAIDQFAPAKGRIAFSMIIDLYLAYKLWQGNDDDSARRWVLVRVYLGFLIYGVFLSFFLGSRGEIFGALVNFIIYLFFLVSIALVLHGKESPTQSRVMIGVGTFAVYFLMTFGVLGLSSLVMFAPSLAKFNLPSSSQIEKYKIEGAEFQDTKTGAKVSLPEGWMLISTSNPVMSSPTAKMIAFGKQSESISMLEVVPVPASVDIKNTNNSELLEYLSNYVSEHFAEELQSGNPSLGKVTAKEVTRMSVSVGTHPAKLLVMESTMNYQKFRSHLIITFDELSMYVLHSWCPSDNYEKAKDEFYALEKTFSIPDKIYSPFTQAAENEKK